MIAPLASMSVADEFDSGIGAVPLHMTVLTKVPVARDRSAAVAAAVRGIAATTAPVSIVASGRAGFGHGGAVQVTTVEMSDQLRRLHSRLLNDVCRAGADLVHPVYSGDGYRPHVSDTHDGQLINPGDQLVLTTLAILDCTRPARQLVDKVALAGAM
ncbi:MAG TPA: 2'-5' RNA ligase family protein [Microlunatus sp.]